MPLISVLDEIQAKYHYLRRVAMILVSEGLGVPLSQVYSMATFYNASSPEKKGMFPCSGSAMANSPAISPAQNSFAATRGIYAVGVEERVSSIDSLLLFLLHEITGYLRSDSFAGPGRTPPWQG